MWSGKIIGVMVSPLTLFVGVDQPLSGGNGMVNAGHKQLYFVGFNDFLGLIDEIAREVPQMAANVKKDLTQM